MNRKIMKKFYISGRHLNRIVTCAIFVICSVFIFAIVNSLIDYFSRQTTELYVQNASNVANSYSKLIEMLDKKVRENIEILVNDPRLESESNQQIKSCISQAKEKLPYYISTFEYADLNGNLISSEKNKNISDYKIFKKVLAEAKPDTFIVDEIAHSELLDKICEIYYYPIFSKKNVLKGVVFAEVPIFYLKNIADSLQIGSYNKICLINEDDTIIYHSEKDYLSKKFIYPQNYDTEPDSIFLDESNFDGKNYIYIQQIPNKNWKVAIILPDANSDSFYSRVNGVKKSMIFGFAFGILIVLLILYMISRFITRSFDTTTCVYFQEYFEQKAERLIKQKNKRFVLLACDIRGMKFINQDKGYDVGNKIISSFAKYLRAFASENKGFCAHSYADHFYMIIQINSVSEVIDLISEEIKIIDKNLSSDNIHVYVKFGLSLITQNPAEKANIRQHIGNATFAKNLIKENINKSFEFYSSKIEKQIRHERVIEQEIQNAVLKDEFEVVYQPKIDTQTEKIVSAEALVRWNSSNPELGYLSPAAFIPIFEKNGFVEDLDFIVYEKVFKFIKSQLDKNKKVVPISVNISRCHLEKEKFTQFFKRFTDLFNKYKIPPHFVEVEILERSIKENSDFLKIAIEEFHKAGFLVAMDDFGSGESSLNMLSSLSIDIVKFDQKFLTSENDLNRTVNVVSTLISLGKKLKKITVFEGVETEEQKNCLKSLGCDIIQGYYYSRPLKEADFIKFEEEHL